jgi:hypothetical protein
MHLVSFVGARQKSDVMASKAIASFMALLAVGYQRCYRESVLISRGPWWIDSRLTLS